MDIGPHQRRQRPLGAMTALGLVALGVAALALSACGRRGPLEPPPDPTVVQTPAASTANPDEPFIRRKVPPITPPTRALPIDSLL